MAVYCRKRRKTRFLGVGEVNRMRHDSSGNLAGWENIDGDVGAGASRNDTAFDETLRQDLDLRTNGHHRDEPRERRALITGGAGFVGSHLAKQLLAHGWEVYALDDVSTGSLDNVAHLQANPNFHLVIESVLSPSVVSELVHKCDVVYHLAAAVGVRLIVEQPVRTLLTNIQGTETVLEYCTRFHKRVLVASTSEVYGDHREELPLQEDARRMYGPTTARRWAYADSKAIDEFLALAYRDERDLDCVIVRLFNTVGPRQTGQYGMVIPRFVSNALAGRPLEIYGDGTQTRCFCHVSDTISALENLMDARELTGEIYNVGSMERVSILELAARVLEKTASDSEIEFLSYDKVYGHGIEDMLHRIPAISKIGDAIGWRPTRTLDDILEDVIDHERSRVLAPPEAPPPRQRAQRTAANATRDSS
jgi:UDP-glucose 4-epimerase